MTHAREDVGIAAVFAVMQAVVLGLLLGPRIGVPLGIAFAAIQFVIRRALRARKNR